MRLHTDIITKQDITAAARKAGPNVAVANLSEHGSRSRGRAFEVNLSGSGRYGGQWDTRTEKTAEWDEWGNVLGLLYEQDPRLIVGSPGRPTYANTEHFHWSTGDRYRVTRMVCRHKWDHAGIGNHRAYTAHQCRKCGAYRRSILSGHTVQEVINYENGESA